MWQEQAGPLVRAPRLHFPSLPGSAKLRGRLCHWITSVTAPPSLLKTPMRGRCSGLCLRPSPVQCHNFRADSQLFPGLLARAALSRAGSDRPPTGKVPAELELSMKTLESSNCARDLSSACILWSPVTVLFSTKNKQTSKQTKQNKKPACKYTPLILILESISEQNLQILISKFSQGSIFFFLIHPNLAFKGEICGAAAQCAASGRLGPLFKTLGPV